MIQRDTSATTALTILDPDQTSVVKGLDDIFVSWARAVGAVEICPPPIYPVADLNKFDVYRNFPHLAFVASPLEPNGMDTKAGHGRFEPADLRTAYLGLPHATCYGAYLFYENTELPGNTLVTLLNRCFRNESHYEGTRRLLSFQMREIVALGSFDHTQRVLDEFTGKIQRLGEALGLDLSVVPATDPFYESGGARDLLQRLSPVKHEFQCGDLAIASVNTHRNFFGERCGIKVSGADGHAFTSCVAFGLERWLAVLGDRHAGDMSRALDSVHTAAKQVLE
jgi:hypothetical protein